MKIINLFILLLFSCSYQAVGVCNQPLMKKFFLQGSKYSSYQAMTLCGNIKDKCCTLADEIRIQKFWKFRTNPLIQSHYTQVVTNAGNIMKLYDKIMKLDPRLMNIKFLVKKYIPYNHQYCNTKFIYKGHKEFKFISQTISKIKMGILMKFLQKNPNESKKIMDALEIIKKNKQEIHNKKQEYSIIENETDQNIQNLHNDIKTINTHLQNAQAENQRLNQSLQQARSYQQQQSSQYGSSSSYNRSNQYGNPSTSRNSQYGSSSSYNRSNQYANPSTSRNSQYGNPSTSRNQQGSSHHQGNQYGNSHHQSNQYGSSSSYNRSSQYGNPSTSRSQYDSSHNQGNQYGNSHHQGNQYGSSHHQGNQYGNSHHQGNQYGSSHHQGNQYKHQINNTSLEYIKKRNKMKGKKGFDKQGFEVFKLKDLINKHEIQICNSKKRYFKKDLIILNKGRANLCLNMVEKMIDFDNSKYKNYLQLAKSQLNLMESYRANFYCQLCDIHKQKFIDLNKKQLQISEHQCSAMLIQLEPLVKFLNVIMIEYVDFLIQVKQCYDSSPKSPNQIDGILQRYKQRIPLILKCYKNLNDGAGIGFYKDCWFLCQNFHWNKMSKIFEGDLEMFKRMFFLIYSFVRRQHENSREIKIMEKILKSKKSLKFKSGSLGSKVQSKMSGSGKNDTLTVDGQLLEPLNPSHLVSNTFYLAKKDRYKIFGRVKNYKVLTKEQIGVLGEYLDQHVPQFKKKIVKAMLRKRNKYIKEIRIRKKFKKALKRVAKKAKTHERGRQWLKTIKLKYKDIKRTPADHFVRKLKNQKNQTKKERKLHLKQFLKVKKISDKIMNIINDIDIDYKKQEYQKLLLNPKIDNIYAQQKTFERNLAQRKRLVAPESDKNARVELGVEIYQKLLNLVDLNKIKQVYLPSNGINLVQGAHFVNFNKNTSGLISEFFKIEETVQPSAVNEYLSVTIKQVNNFNHTIDEYITIHQELAADTQKLYILQKQFQLSTNPKERIKISDKLKKLRREYSWRKKTKEDRIFLKKLKKVMKDLKIKLKQKKIVVENHVTKKHFDQNFNGVSDLFVNIFGS